MNQLVTIAATHAAVAASGERASYRFIELFTVTIKNAQTRSVYMRAVGESLALQRNSV